jgi:excisionase family DNA binding protein
MYIHRYISYHSLQSFAIASEEKLTVKKISYKEAARLLNVPETRIRNAVSRGSLTKVTTNGVHKFLYEEQVKLFLNKPFALAALNSKELQRWAEIDNLSKDEQTTNAPSPVAGAIPVDEKIAEEQGFKYGSSYAYGMIRGIYNELENFCGRGQEFVTSPLAR